LLLLMLLMLLLLLLLISIFVISNPFISIVSKQDPSSALAVDAKNKYGTPVDYSPPSLRGRFGRASCRVEFVLSGT
jgi:hypothetical protein